MTDLVQWLLITAAGAIAVSVGYLLGAHVTSERFYDACQGGEVVLSTPTGNVNVVGCAEIARHIR